VQRAVVTPPRWPPRCARTLLSILNRLPFNEMIEAFLRRTGQGRTARKTRSAEDPRADDTLT